MLLEKKKFHFVGIGGIGMSGIALILLEMGYKVSGSDLSENDLTNKIKSRGGRVYLGHSAANIADDVEVIVYSSSITDDNPEFIEARKRGLPIVQRARVLGELVNTRKGIAISGMHGKTTTTSLVSVMLENLKMDPTVVIGGEIDLFKGNAKYGKGEYVVAEADESDGSFLHLHPLYTVITNIEEEHMDFYRSLDDIIAVYRAFTHNLKDGGAIFYHHADKNIEKALKDYTGARETYGLSKEADMYPRDIEMKEFATTYECVYKGKTLGSVSLKIPGKHNILNSMASILIGLKLGHSFEKVRDSIKDFIGTKRRFHLKAESGGVMVIDDYAHHPTEIRAVLDAARNWKDKRLIVIFQPHRYTRTLHLADEFGKCFDAANKLILTDIYAASEEPIEGVSVKNIYDRVKANGHSDVVVMEKEKIADYVMEMKRPGDMILVLGAGNIKDVATELSDRLKALKNG